MRISQEKGCAGTNGIIAIRFTNLHAGFIRVLEPRFVSACNDAEAKDET